ncbi:MAG: multiheme c-type cytochrome [Solidesulfovibrio sp. DCME]|uniref:multiheme c-type cytochrome n=1 Tax=Solidesulfovibrio sp. DCME TaxID=3447380 RepID=UPI003D150D4F
MGWQRTLAFVVAGLLTLCPLLAGPARADGARYVGTAACAGCHPTEHTAFEKYSKKAHSSKNVRLMAAKLSPEELAGCFVCHATGYGKPGGFTSLTATPELADAGCEVCHGPGSLHTASGDPAAIKGKPTVDDCRACHSDARVRAFGFKPLLRAGAH